LDFRDFLRDRVFERDFLPDFPPSKKESPKEPPCLRERFLPDLLLLDRRLVNLRFPDRVFDFFRKLFPPEAFVLDMTPRGGKR
jgi:hypothetical protein